MTPFVALLVAGPPTVAGTLDASARAHAALNRFRAVVTVDFVQSKARSAATYDLTVDGADVLLRVQEGETQSRAKSDRTFLFRPGRVVAYDAIARQYLTRPSSLDAPRLVRVMDTLGPVHDLLRYLLDGRQIGAFYGYFGQLRNWKVTSGATGTRLLRNVVVPNGRNVADLRFAPRTFLLTSIGLQSPENSTKWQIRYLPPRRAALLIPKGTAAVSAFTVAPAPPRYATAAARTLTNAMLRAYANLRQGIVTIKDDSGTTKLVLDGPKLREENPDCAYAYDGRVLTIFDRRRKRYYRGETSRSRVPDAIVAAGCRPDSISRQILEGRVPFRELLVPEMTVQIAGSVEMSGIATDILRFESRRTRVTLFVRKKDRLVDGATTTTLDSGNRPLMTTGRQFRYANMGRAQEASQFRIVPAAGASVRPLPKLGG
jgi:hypothetical protein